MWFYVMKVKPVEPANDYQLYIETQGGQSGIFDMKPWIEDEPDFQELQDIEYFRKAHVKMGEVAWPNGQYLTSAEVLSKIAPETLYQKEQSSKLVRCVYCGVEITFESSFPAYDKECRLCRSCHLKEEFELCISLGDKE